MKISETSIRGQAVGRNRRASHRLRTCEVCSREIPVDEVIQALVPDSSVAPPETSGDGRRMVTVCSTGELRDLVASGRATWIDEQLWLGQLRRASTRERMRGASLLTVARDASLTHEQLRRLLAWNTGRDNPSASLPGGQPLR